MEKPVILVVEDEAIIRMSAVQMLEDAGFLVLAQPTLHPDVALNLALAVIASSTAPLLLLNGDLSLVAASTSFCKAFQIDPDTIPDRPLRELGAGEWDVPQLNVLLKATASGQADVEGYEIDLCRPGWISRHLVLNAQKLDYGNAENVRLLVSVLDVTDARLAEKLKNDLIKEKEVLLQELHHRVANSLQIIASVLMQSARKVQSEESRLHLHDAHHRVMSVASLQKQLAASKLGDVELRPYFKALCESIGASMIHDHDKISLDVTADDSVTTADTSVSLGLIVTELVINSLKHAFPEERSGKIHVDYSSRGPNWSLSVVDDGVGMPPEGAEPAKAGLGTSIVNALADQLSARINVVGWKSRYQGDGWPHLCACAGGTVSATSKLDHVTLRVADRPAAHIYPVHRTIRPDVPILYGIVANASQGFSHGSLNPRKVFRMYRRPKIFVGK